MATYDVPRSKGGRSQDEGLGDGSILLLWLAAILGIGAVCFFVWEVAEEPLTDFFGSFGEAIAQWCNAILY